MKSPWPVPTYNHLSQFNDNDRNCIINQMTVLSTPKVRHQLRLSKFSHVPPLIHRSVQIASLFHVILCHNASNTTNSPNEFLPFAQQPNIPAATHFRELQIACHQPSDSSLQPHPDPPFCSGLEKLPPFSIISTPLNFDGHSLSELTISEGSQFFLIWPSWAIPSLLWAKRSFFWDFCSFFRLVTRFGGLSSPPLLKPDKVPSQSGVIKVILSGVVVIIISLVSSSITYDISNTS